MGQYHDIWGQIGWYFGKNSGILVEIQWYLWQISWYFVQLWWYFGQVQWYLLGNMVVFGGKKDSIWENTEVFGSNTVVRLENILVVWKIQRYLRQRGNWAKYSSILHIEWYFRQIQCYVGANTVVIRVNSVVLR